MVASRYTDYEFRFRRWGGRWLPALLLPLAALLAACGAASTPTPMAESQPSPTPIQEASDTNTPVAETTPTPQPQTAGVEQSGTLDVARAEIQRFSGHPALATGPNQTFVGATIGESLLNIDANGQVISMLAESWEASADFKTWTFHLREGVQFHKGYGDMTAEDVVWSMQGWGDNTTHPQSGIIRDFWADAEAKDKYTVVARPEEPTTLIQMSLNHSAPAGSGTIITSKTQAQEIGDEAANRDTAATSPWEHVSDDAQQWTMRAVDEHWRQVPYFEELKLWGIPEESSRLAGLETGNLDTTAISIDSIPRARDISGVRLMSVPNALSMTVNPYGGWYIGAGTAEQVEAYDSDLPWVSSNPDPESEEWKRARDVRKALYLAIDWQTIVDELFLGFGTVDPFIYGYAMNRDLLGDRAWFGYKPDRARELLAEAGYQDGFSMTVTPVMLRPFEPLTCEAMAQMWENELGLDINLQKVAYSSGLRPQVIGRTYQGVTCHVTAPVPGPSLKLPYFRRDTVWNWGANHPWLEDKVNESLATVDPEERKKLQAELGKWVFDNALTSIIPFTLDAVWPVGPAVEPWPDRVRRADLRYLSGFEYARPRE